MEYLEKRANEVFDRYSMVEGCLPLRLEPIEEGEKRSYHVVLGDGRKLVHLSSGQKAQAALAMLVGQNHLRKGPPSLAANNRFPFGPPHEAAMGFGHIVVGNAPALNGGK